MKPIIGPAIFAALVILNPILFPVLLIALWLLMNIVVGHLWWQIKVQKKMLGTPTVEAKVLFPLFFISLPALAYTAWTEMDNVPYSILWLWIKTTFGS